MPWGKKQAWIVDILTHLGSLWSQILTFLVISGVILRILNLFAVYTGHFLFNIMSTVCGYIAWGGRIIVDYKLASMWKEVATAYFKILSFHLLNSGLKLKPSTSQMLITTLQRLVRKLVFIKCALGMFVAILVMHVMQCFKGLSVFEIMSVNPTGVYQKREE